MASGRVYEDDRETMVPDATLTIRRHRRRRVASRRHWGGKPARYPGFRSGYDIDKNRGAICRGSS
jgi:hypothetical protein